jgi:anti-sigma factor RsiW
VTYEDLPCQRVVELLTDLLESALPTDDALAVERHLASCQGCATYLEQLRDTIKATGALREEDVPAEVMAPLLDAFRRLHS